jgi:hypothetical protein
MLRSMPSTNGSALNRLLDLFLLVDIGMALSILNHPMTIKVAKAKDDGGKVA